IRNNIVAGGIRSRDGGAFVAARNLVTAYAFANWIPGGARYLKLPLEGQDAKYPNYISAGQVRWAQGVVDRLAEVTGSGWLGRGNGKFDRWFVAPGLGNFELLDGSDIVDRGEALAEASDDFCGRRRTPPHDLGAIEYSAGDCDLRAMAAQALASDVRR